MSGVRISWLMFGDEGALQPIDLLDAGATAPPSSARAASSSRVRSATRDSMSAGTGGGGGLFCRSRICLLRSSWRAAAGCRSRPLARIFAQRLAQSGCRNAYPVSIVRTGIARWLGQQELVGHGAERQPQRERGRLEHRRASQRLPQRATNSPLVTGSGATRLSGPLTASCDITWRMRPISSSRAFSTAQPCGEIADRDPSGGAQGRQDDLLPGELVQRGHLLTPVTGIMRGALRHLDAEKSNQCEGIRQENSTKRKLFSFV